MAAIRRTERMSLQTKVKKVKIQEKVLYGHQNLLSNKASILAMVGWSQQQYCISQKEKKTLVDQQHTTRHVKQVTGINSISRKYYTQILHSKLYDIPSRNVQLLTTKTFCYPINVCVRKQHSNAVISIAVHYHQKKKKNSQQPNC